jgi:hypothetical protein
MSIVVLSFLDAIGLLRFARVPDCQRIAWSKLLGVDVTSVIGATHIADLEVLIRDKVGGNCFGAFVIAPKCWDYC